MTSTPRVEVDCGKGILSPGSVSVLSVRVVNSSQRVDEYAIDLVGIDPSWVTVTPATVPLLPGRDGTATISIATPAERPPTAGPLTVGVRVASRADTRARWVEEVELTVASVSAATFEVRPQLVRAGSSASLTATVINQGNVPLRVALSGEDTEGQVAFDFTPQALDVEPFQQRSARVRLRAPRPFSGAPVQRTLTLAATGGPHQLRASAVFAQKSWVAAGLLSVLSALALLAVGTGAYLVLNQEGSTDGSQPTSAPGTAPAGGSSPTGTGGGSSPSSTETGGGSEGDVLVTAVDLQVSPDEIVGSCPRTVTITASVEAEGAGEAEWSLTGVADRSGTVGFSSEGEQIVEERLQVGEAGQSDTLRFDFRAEGPAGAEEDDQEIELSCSAITLHAEGLGVASFDEPQQDALDAVGNATGVDPEDIGGLLDGGPPLHLHRFGSLLLAFRPASTGEAQFAGYYYRGVDTPAELRTDEEVGVGSSLEDAFGPEFPPPGAPLTDGGSLVAEFGSRICYRATDNTIQGVAGGELCDAPTLDRVLPEAG